MTNDHKLLKELDKTVVSKVQIGNGDFITVKGKKTVAIENLSGMKYIYDVLSDQNLLSVPQLFGKGFKVIFEDNVCLIKDVKDKDVFKIKMRVKWYALNQPIKKALPETYDYSYDDIKDVPIRRSNEILVNKSNEFKVDD